MSYPDPTTVDWVPLSGPAGPRRAVTGLVLCTGWRSTRPAGHSSATSPSCPTPPGERSLNAMNVHYKRVKYIVQGVIAEMDEDGNILGEQTTQQTALYSPEQLFGFVSKLDEDIAAANAQASENGQVVVEEKEEATA